MGLRARKEKAKKSGNGQRFRTCKACKLSKSVDDFLPTKRGKRQHNLCIDCHKLFPVEEMYQRDGGICGICFEPIKSVRAANRDHIIPFNKGGKHIVENVCVSHRECNGQKGDAAPWEMTGFGRSKA